MNVMTALSIPEPTVAYTILHQGTEAVDAAAYEQTMREMHVRVLAESRAIEEAFRKQMSESAARQGQILRGTLAQFLATPIRTDVAEVQRIIGEAFEKLASSGEERRAYGAVDSLEGRIIITASRKSIEKKLLQGGRAVLEGLGFNQPGTERRVYESVFLVCGGIGLDILEHIVRDRIGIASAPHGAHVAQAAGFVFEAYNVVATRGALPASGNARAGMIEGMLMFSKPDLSYDQFRSDLEGMMEGLCAGMALPLCTLWQRKLGLGRRPEFILRWYGHGQNLVEQVIEWLHARKEPASIVRALLHEGSLLVKEIVD
jgi:hypothetical protein